MKIYFVRHGESEQTDKVHQSPETILTDHGKAQARHVAKFLSHIHIDTIITSTYARSMLTAQEIAKTIKVPIIRSNLFIERRMPHSFVGKPVQDEALSDIHQSIRDNFYNKNWHHEDEENFYDITARVKKALEFIITENKQEIIVVTHGYFLTILIFYILFSDTDHPEAFKEFKQKTEFSNGGITMCEYIDKKWKVLTVNGITHLHLSSGVSDLFE